jgi:hypothetical protein
LIGMPGHSACILDVHYLSRSVILAYAILRGSDAGNSRRDQNDRPIT